MPDYKQALKQYEKIGGNEQTKGYFGILATLALLIVLLLLVFPAIKHVTKLNKEISDARLVKTKLENKLDDIEQAKINLEAVRSDLHLLDLALPVGSNLPKYLIRVEKLASKHKLKIYTVQFSNIPLSKPSVEKLELSTKNFVYDMTFEGKFGNFRKFIKDLERLVRISDINTINVIKEKDTPLRHSISVSSYYLGVSFVSTDKTETGAQNLEQGGTGVNTGE